MRPEQTLAGGRHGAQAETVRAIHGELQRLTGLSLPLRLWDGSEVGDPEAGFRLVLRHPWSLRAMMLPPSDLTAGEAYVESAVDIDGDAVAA
ncbi:MAG: class I SAM-dependent methyltransferase, partial [Actinomycetota bacterium]|nr:class I SAM-dependent methyltransferase [Actinomycetota bacterium]